MKKLALAFALAGTFTVAAQTSSLEHTQYKQDLDEFLQRAELGYAYSDLHPVDWQAVRALGESQLAGVKNTTEFAHVINNMLEQLYDYHTEVRPRPRDAQLPVPTASFVWGEVRGDKAFISQVRRGGYGERQGFKPGMEILTINGVPVDNAISERLSNPSLMAKNWALNAILTGKRGQELEIGVSLNGKAQTLTLNVNDAIKALPKYGTRLVAERIGEFGYIRPENSLGDNGLIADFDAALDRLKNTKGLILDLRNTPSGGNTDVARGIMSRFIKSGAPYQAHELVAVERMNGVKRAWREWVYPRGPFTYDAPLIVLSNRWTGSMGEGLTIGLHGLKRAVVVGTPMAHLLGAIYTEYLPNTGLGYNLPAEKLYHVDGTPREAFKPDHEIDHSHNSDNEDLALKQALSLLGSKRQL